MAIQVGHATRKLSGSTVLDEMSSVMVVAATAMTFRGITVACVFWFVLLCYRVLSIV